MKILGIGIGFQFIRRLLGLPSCIRDIAIAWWKDFNNIQRTTTITEGVIDFDGIDDYISYDSLPNVTGNKIIKFNLYLINETTIPLGWLISIGDGGNDVLSVNLFNGSITFNSSNAGNGGKSYSLTGLSNKILTVVVEKSAGVIDSVTINSVLQTPTGTDNFNFGISTGFEIGRRLGSSNYVSDCYIWNFEIEGIFTTTGINNSWDDTTGTLVATLNGNPATTNVSESSFYIEDFIGTRWSDIYYGQYLDATSGQINLYRSSGTYNYTNPQTGDLVQGNSIPVDGLITIPATGICNLGINPSGISPVTGLINFDGIDDYVSFGSALDVAGNKTISFSLYLINETGIIRISIKDSDDYFICNILPFSTSVIITIITNSDGTTSPSGTNVFIIPGNKFNQILNVTINKITKTINGITVNEVDYAPSNTNSNSSIINNQTYIGRYDSSYTNSSLSGYIWNFNINDEHSYNTLWEDQVGSNDGVINGSPITIDLDIESSITYENFYPIVERAGIVLHDVLEDSKHVSIDSPVWSESLYGSDFLNQCGFIDKEMSDYMRYDWETEVDGSDVILDDDALVPVQLN